MKITLYIIFIGLSLQFAFSQSSGNNGTITGHVSLEGTEPAVPLLPVHKDVHCCGTTTPSPRLSVGEDNGLKNAVVYLEQVTGGKRYNTTEPVLLDQKECHFEPHVVVVPFGGQLVIRNSDEVLHNVRAYNIKDGKTVFNIAQPIKGQQTSIRPTLFDKPGIYHATCDAGHPWMSAFIVVAEHPYYTVTSDDGSFTLEDVPPGTYQLTVWHSGVHVKEKRTSGSEIVQYVYEDPYMINRTVEVQQGSVAAVDVTFTLR